MKRLRLYDVRLSNLPESVGLCQADITSIAKITNSAQQRLIYAKEAGDEGWWGTWAEIAFNVTRDEPYITLPRGVARLQSVNVCSWPVGIQNQFYEYLTFGNGRMPKTVGLGNNCFLQGYSRNNSPTFVDLSNGPQIIMVYASDPQDAGKRVLLQGLDNNDVPIRTMDSANSVEGVFVSMVLPFASAPMQFNSITGIQKDITVGQVKIYQADPTTGDQVLLLTMEAGEQTAWYRRYYFGGLPDNCCSTPSAPADVQVAAIAKLELVPVAVDTDYCLIQNLEAITLEAQAVRYSKMDIAGAKQMAQEAHIQAIRLLNGELNHYLGSMTPATSLSVFGSARLERQGIGVML